MRKECEKRSNKYQFTWDGASSFLRFPELHCDVGIACACFVFRSQPLDVERDASVSFHHSDRDISSTGFQQIRTHDACKSSISIAFKVRQKEKIFKFNKNFGFNRPVLKF